jgi:cell shape-determining protein MreC
MAKAINDSLNLTISVPFLAKIIVITGIVVGGWYQAQMKFASMERTITELHSEVIVLNQKMAQMEKEHVEELGEREHHNEALEEENKSLMQKLGLKKK